MTPILYFLIIILAFFQLFYIIDSVRKSQPKKNKFKIHHTDKLSIIIPVCNEEKNLPDHLSSILKNNLSLVKKIILVLDHCTDNSEKIIYRFKPKFRRQNINLKLVKLPAGISGKVNGILYGVKYASTKNVLLIDADIVLDTQAIEKLFTFHMSNHNRFTTCLVYPFQDNTNHNLISEIICNDRLYRQNILQITRNKFSLANFPGGIGIVNIHTYIRYLKSGFLEDLTATYKLFLKKEKIVVLSEPLAAEIERQTLKGVFWQRTRWTIGNIENLNLFFHTLSHIKGMTKKFILSSYPLLWYLQHYFIVIGLLMLIFAHPNLPETILLITPSLLYFIQILISAHIGQNHYHNTIIGLLIHSLLYPFIITASLFGAIYTIIKTRKFYFNNTLSKHLFSRI